MAGLPHENQTSSQTPSPVSQKESNKYEDLSLALLNINGLRNKTHEIRHIIARDKLHVVALCETRLNSTVKESDVYIPGFSMWRRDMYDNSDNKGGGVALYVQDHIKTRLRPDLMKAEADEKNPKADEENPKADEENPKADEENPKADEENPKADEENPEADEENPKADEENPEADEENPKADEENPKADEENPEADEENPEADEENPKADEENPKADEENPKADEENPKADEENPEADEENPKADEENPKADEENPEADKKNPEAEEENPKAEEENPKADEKNPKADEKNPEAEEENPKAEEENPKADEKNPKADEKNPKADKKNPKADKENPKADKKNPKADKKNPKAIIWVEMEFPDSRPVLLGCCYRPTKDKKKYFEQIKETITLMSEKEKGKDIFLMGDFNIDWLSNSEKENADVFITSEGWTQIVKAATRLTLDSATCIDHIYTNIKDPLEPKNIPTGCSDHNLITVKINRNIPERERNFRSKEFNKEKFQEEIQNKMNKVNTSDISLKKFTEEFLKVADEHAPLNSQNFYCLLKLNKPLEDLVSKRDNTKYKMIQNIYDLIKKKIKLQENINKYINENSGGKNDAIESEETFPFHSPKIEASQKDPEGTNGSHSVDRQRKRRRSGALKKTRLAEVKTCLEYVCDHVVKVIDETEAELIKLSVEFISAPILKILDRYKKTGNFPDELKKSKSFPFSTDNYSDIRQSSGAERLHIILNYLFDVILYEQAKPYFIEDENKQTKSIATLQGKLEQPKTDWLSLGEANTAAEAVLLDFTSSFDKISHDLLITKLQKPHYSDSNLKLIESFLSIQKGSSGLPRISCLSQLFHIIIINDLKKNLGPSAVICNNYMMIFAHGDPKTIESELNQKMETVRTWAEEFNILFKETQKQFNILFKVRRKQFKLSELSAMFKILESMIRCHGDKSNWIRAPGNIVKQNGDWKYDNISKELELHFGKEYKVEPDNFK
ncbi:titin-like [Xiphophorus maculatus]|uniref:Titin-like n=1 Tax=Xiphophorus maculatus TaxID=8083 RepID=A0A3B5PYD0_XIPMA|nr:titin-like [Xiphophorus maculatus]XP_023203026.1 titin-like [Xiphophorus maculatus]XP_023203028.1 titin-like [Xiphophorus maculatus]